MLRNVPSARMVSRCLAPSISGCSVEDLPTSAGGSTGGATGAGGGAAGKGAGGGAGKGGGAGAVAKRAHSMIVLKNPGTLGVWPGQEDNP